MALFQLIPSTLYSIKVGCQSPSTDSNVFVVLLLFLSLDEDTWDT